MSPACSLRRIWTSGIWQTHLLFAVAAQVQNPLTLARRALIVSVVFGVPLLIFGSHYIKWPFLLVAVVVGATTTLVTLSWFKGNQLEVLLLEPYTRKNITLSAGVLGVVSTLISDAIPLGVFLYLSHTLSASRALATLFVAALASATAFSAVTLLRNLIKPAGFSYKKRVSLASGADKITLPLNDTNTFASHPLSQGIKSYITDNYLLFLIIYDARTWYSLAAMTGLGLISSGYLLQIHVFFPVHSLCLALTPTLSFLLSRNLDTRKQLLLLKGESYLKRHYAAALCVLMYPIIILGDVALCFFSPPNVIFFISSIVSYAAAIITIIILEIRFPVLEWKTEYELFMRTRRYYPLLAATAVAGLFYFFYSYI